MVGCAALVEHAIPTSCDNCPRSDIPSRPDVFSADHREVRLTHGTKPEHYQVAQTTGLSACDEPAFTCAACGTKILERYYLLAVDKPWHVTCLRCAECRQPLDTQGTCFSKDGRIYCKEDYYRMFGVKRCSRCHMSISANELIMRARDLVYHLTCFTCFTCNKPLNTGDYFGMKDDVIYCQAHYEVLLQDEYLTPCNFPPGVPTPEVANGLPPEPSAMQPLPYFNGMNAPQKGRPRKRKNGQASQDTGVAALGLGPGDLEGSALSPDGYPSQQHRQKRMRTSFKHHQLRTMKSYFALNQNPDAKDLKQLSQKTGLSKRVLQVWFQNARAKYRRNLIRQQQDSGSGQGSSEGKSESRSGGIDGERSPSFSDISSTPSLSELQSTAFTEKEDHQSGNSISDLFGNTMNTLN